MELSYEICHRMLGDYAIWAIYNPEFEKWYRFDGKWADVLHEDVRHYHNAAFIVGFDDDDGEDGGYAYTGHPASFEALSFDADAGDRCFLVPYNPELEVMDFTQSIPLRSVLGAAL